MVGAEPLEILRRQVLGRQDQDRYFYRRLCTANTFQHRKTVDLRHHQIQNNAVRDGTGNVINGFLPASGHIGNITGGFENRFDLNDHRFIILDDQNPGRGRRVFDFGVFWQAFQIHQDSFDFCKQGY